MRAALATIFQVTNTFSSQQTLPDAFFGDLVMDPAQAAPPCDPFGVYDMLGSIADVAKRTGDTIVPMLMALARSSGPATAQTMASITARLRLALEEVYPPADALILVLSGAMIDEFHHSADLQLIRAARSAVPSGTPVVALFGSEANLGSELVNSVDLALGFDALNDEATAQLAERTLQLAGMIRRHEVRPVSCLRRLPLLVSPAARQRGAESMRVLSGLAEEFRTQLNVLDVSLFAGFPYADVTDAGFHVLVTTDNDYDRATILAERLQHSMWDLRETFDVAFANVETVVHEAMVSEQGPVVILDAGDDPAFGATGDGTGLLWALIDLGAPNSALGVIVDPAAVARSIAAGVGATLQTDIGGAIDHRAGYPIHVTARVRRISAGKPNLGGGCHANVGRAVVLDVEGRHGGQVDVIVTEQAPPAVVPELFRALGIDVTRKRIVAAKSSGQTQTSFESISRQILTTSTPGITTPALHYLDFQRVSRPVYPLDSM